MVIALAAIAVPAVTASGSCNEHMQGEAAFGPGKIAFPSGQDSNFDQLTVGNDQAIAAGVPGWFFWGDPVAKNNLNIEKVQKSVKECKSCCEAREETKDGKEVEIGESPDKCQSCQNACSLVNLEQIHVGTRIAIASGPRTLAENNVNIKTVQV
jgi:hypothetical protein